MAEGSPGIADGSPGIAEGSPGIADGSPGIAEGSPGIADGSPGIADGSPGIADGSEGIADGSPGIADGSEGMLADGWDGLGLDDGVLGEGRLGEGGGRLGEGEGMLGEGLLLGGDGGAAGGGEEVGGMLGLWQAPRTSARRAGRPVRAAMDARRSRDVRIRSMTDSSPHLALGLPWLMFGSLLLFYQARGVLNDKSGTTPP